MIKFILGVIVGTIWSTEILFFWNSSGIGDALKQQYEQFLSDKSQGS